jgi:hypothetical protein
LEKTLLDRNETLQKEDRKREKKIGKNSEKKKSGNREFGGGSILRQSRRFHGW